MSRLAKFLRLTWPERGLFFLALLLLSMIALGLSLFGFQRTKAALAGTAVSGATTDNNALSQARQTARIVTAAARYGPYKATCLPIALTLIWLLDRQGIETVLRLGVSKTDARLEAHAWVEYQGLPLNENQDVHERFAAFDKTAPSAAAAPK